MGWTQPSYYPPPPRPRRSGGPWVALLVLVLFAAAVAGWVVFRLRTPIRPLASARPIAARGDLAADEAATVALFEQASPSVVHITNVGVRSDYFGLNVMEIPQGTGSGFV